MLVRPCKESDLPRILDIEREAMEMYYQAGFSKEDVLPRTEEDLRFLLAKTDVVVAVDGENLPLGYASYYLAGSFLHLEEHVVHPIVQRQGVGSLLLAHFLEVGQLVPECQYYSLLAFPEASWAVQGYKRAGFCEASPMELEMLPDDALKRMLDLEHNQYARCRVALFRVKE